MTDYKDDIVEIKRDIKGLHKDVAELKSKTTVHDERITALNKTLDDIQENTLWIKRTITKSIIGAICTGIIGGAIALFYASLNL
ncbi:hemolysin XhlA family protein [Bacillus sp. FSL W7-1360]